jgi:hypothetical protein
MAAAALVIAGLALVVSLVSVYFVRSQAMVNIDRRHDELDRKWDAKIVMIENTPSYELRLRLLGPRDVDTIYVEIVDAQGLSFARQSPYVPDGNAFPQEARFAALRQGQTASWGISLGEDRAPRAHLRVTSTKKKGTWSSNETVDVPIDISRSVW